MGFFNPIAYFIRQFFRFLRGITGKLFIIFFLLFCCLILAMCIDKGVFAFSGSGISTYGNYNRFTESDISSINSLIETYKGSYDSFYCRQLDNNSNDSFIITFYNSNEVTLLSNRANSSTLSNLALVYTLGDIPPSFLHIKCDRYFNYKSQVTDNTSFVQTSTNNGNITGAYLYCNRDIYDVNGANIVFESTNNSIADIEPFIETESSTIVNWSFDYLHINSGSETIYYNNVLNEQTTATLYLDYIYDGIRYRYQIPSNLYGINTNDTFDIYIPRTSLLNNVNITNGSNVSFYLGIRKNSESVFPLGSYTFNLTTEEQEQIQQDSDKALQGEILGAQQETNNKLDNLDNTLTDSNVADITADTLPSDSTNDITADGVNGIFTSIYNAFCVGNAQDIVFPIPFTDKTITLSANYISNALTNSGATFIITIIQAFWWYIISRFIIKDIMGKINKIKGGDIENIETTNIRGDML